MPRIKPITKSCCPLCEELQELKYRYDICEECHQDLIKEDGDSEWDPDSINVAEPDDSDTDVEELPDGDPGLERSPAFEDDSKDVQ